jgi:putative membrane protein
MQAFVEEEVFDTRDRTGILLFVSLREHRIEVLGDAGINQQVDPDDWVEVVARIQRGIQNDNLTEGLVEAIEMCGQLLERKGVDLRADDENELTDTVRTPGRGDASEDE